MCSKSGKGTVCVSLHSIGALVSMQRWKKRLTPSVLIFSSCAIIFWIFTHFFAQFCCVFEHFLQIFANFCKKLIFLAYFCTFMRFFAHIFCANISSSKIVSVLFFTLFPTLHPCGHQVGELSCAYFQCVYVHLVCIFRCTHFGHTVVNPYVVQ